MSAAHRPSLALDKPLLNCSCGDMGFFPAEFEQHRKGATSPGRAAEETVAEREEQGGEERAKNADAVASLLEDTTITDERVGRAYAEVMEHAPISDFDTRRINCGCGERDFTPNGHALHRVRVILETT